MIRSVVNTAVLRPGLACLQARGMSRAKPIYYNPADADLAEEKQFDVEYGIREDIPERGPLEMIHKWEYVARGVDPWFRFKARIGYFFGAERYYIQSEEEKAERAILTDRLHAFYDTIPQKYPDGKWWGDVVDHYVRYNDVEGARKLWEWLIDYRIDIDQSLHDKFQRFFYESDPLTLTQKSLCQKLRQANEEIPLKPSDNTFRIGEYGIEHE